MRKWKSEVKCVKSEVAKCARLKLATSDIVGERLRNQKLVQSDVRDPVGVVSWLGAVQSQDYPGAKWAAAACACTGFTDAAVDEAFDAWRHRAHAHPAADVALRGAGGHPLDAGADGPARSWRGSRCTAARTGLDDKVLARSRRVLERALAGGKFLTRAALGAALTRAGIAGRRPSVWPF